MSIDNGDMPTSPIFDSTGRSIEHYDSYYATGLTKREHFAAIAMQGILSTGFRHEEEVAKQAIKAADALLKGLDK